MSNLAELASPSPLSASSALALQRRPGARDPGYWFLFLGTLLLWWTGYPPPHLDDLFFTGASVELARSGHLANPWIEPWLRSLGTDSFFVMPPVLPYTLALWVKWFGVSSGSIRAFHLGVQLLLQLLVYRTLRLAGGSILVGLAAAGVTWLFAIDYGLRPDALAVLLIVLGQLAFCRNRPAWWTAGGFLAASAVLVHPLALAFAIPVFLFSCPSVTRETSRAVQLAAWAALGIATAGVMFLVEIGGRLSEFWRSISAARGLISSTPWYARPTELLAYLGEGKKGWFYAAIFGVAIVAAGRTWFGPETPDRRLLRRWFCAWAVALVLGFFLYPARALQYVGYAGLLLTLASFCQARHASLIAGAVLVLPIVHNLGLCVLLVLRPAQPTVTADFASAIRTASGKTLCVDEVAARFLFDFRLPPGARNWLLRQASPEGAHGTLAAKPRNELWIVNEWKLEHYVADANVHAERLTFGPFVMHSVPREPYRLRVIR